MIFIAALFDMVMVKSFEVDRGHNYYEFCTITVK